MADKSSNQGKKINSGQKARSNSATQAGTKAQSAVKDFVNGSTFGIDPFGSYTGHSKDEGEKPVQDVDDL